MMRHLFLRAHRPTLVAVTTALLLSAAPAYVGIRGDSAHVDAAPGSLQATTVAASERYPAAATAVCGRSILKGPSARPRGANLVRAGNNRGFSPAPSRTYYFAPGIHTFGTGSGNMFDANSGDTFEGAPGAILTGQGDQQGAIGGNVRHVTIKYLTIEDTNPPNGSSSINNSSKPYWTVEFDTIADNGQRRGSGYGYAVDLGSDNILASNCLTKDGEGAFNDGCIPDCARADPWGGPKNITIDNNEISYDGLSEYPDLSCGCSAGGKLFLAENVTVLGNYVHDNYDVGLWFDFNNSGFDISRNYIASNWAEGLNYEASYNASITDNIFVGNGWSSDGPWPSPYSAGDGIRSGSGFPLMTIYLSESGGDAAVRSRYSGSLIVSGNLLTNNWGGIGTFADRNRFCGSPYQGNCTLDDPSVYYDNPAVSATDAVENGTTTVSSADGFRNTQTGSLTVPKVGALVYGWNVPRNDTIASCSSSHDCTLSEPTTGSGTGIEIDTATAGGCGPVDLAGTRSGNAYFEHCRWNAQNLTVSNNIFSNNASWVTSCTAANGCGFMFTMANEGSCGLTCSNWSPFQGTVVEAELWRDKNVWRDNSYSWFGPGSWSFMAANQGHRVSPSTWRRSPYNQDAGSTGV